MIKKNLPKLIAASIIILLPMAAGTILWDKLEDSFINHFSSSNGALGLTVFGMPLILLAFHWICMLITAADPGNKNQNKKIFDTVIWIVPGISVISSVFLYLSVLDIDFSREKLFLAVIAIMFIFIGNYLPKCKQNKTIGIKLPWTIADEENWNKTHRLGGMIWVVTGTVLLFAFFLPVDWAVYVIIAAIAAAALIPTVYSCILWLRSGQSLPVVRSKKNIVVSAVFAVVAVVGICILMFTGNISIEYGEESFKIEASYWSNAEISYDSIESIEYLESIETSQRTNGFGSGRLLLGTFKNEEFGYYTRYTYTKDNDYIKLCADGKILIISGASTEETNEIYKILKEKTA